MWLCVSGNIYLGLIIFSIFTTIQCELIPFSFNLTYQEWIHTDVNQAVQDSSLCLEKQMKVTQNHHSKLALGWCAVSSAVEYPWGWGWGVKESASLPGLLKCVVFDWFEFVKLSNHQIWWAELSALGKTNVVLYLCMCKGCILSQPPAVCSLGSLIKQHHHPRSACATWADKNT